MASRRRWPCMRTPSSILFYTIAVIALTCGLSAGAWWLVTPGSVEAQPIRAPAPVPPRIAQSIERRMAREPERPRENAPAKTGHAGSKRLACRSSGAAVQGSRSDSSPARTATAKTIAPRSAKGKTADRIRAALKRIQGEQRSPPRALISRTEPRPTRPCARAASTDAFHRLGNAAKSSIKARLCVALHPRFSALSSAAPAAPAT